MGYEEDEKEINKACKISKEFFKEIEYMHLENGFYECMNCKLQFHQIKEVLRHIVFEASYKILFEKE